MAMTKVLTIGILAGLAAAGASCGTEVAPEVDWQEQALQKRAAREQELTKEDGWLSVAGLFFLEEGTSPVGSSPDAAIRLPEGTPARAGQITWDGERVLFEPAQGVDATLDGGGILRGPTELRPYDADTGRAADRVRVDRVTLQVHRSGDRIGIRLRDPENPLRRSFTGMRWYDLSSEWRITGRFVPFDEAREVEVENTMGDLVTLASPGVVQAEIAGTQVRLLPLLSEGRLWFVFSDETATRGETYRIRYVYADMPERGRAEVLLDFNVAYSPPCAYNPYTTCPLPPPQNRLPVAITAGELAYVPPAAATE